MVIKFLNGDGEEQELPAKYELCPRCEGKGQHSNPAIDGHGITQDEMEELGPDFREDYFRGVYDIQCERCEGLRAILVPDEEKADKGLLEEYETQTADDESYRAQLAHERRMGY